MSNKAQVGRMVVPIDFPRSNKQVWTIEHEAHCWMELQRWRSAVGPDRLRKRGHLLNRLFLPHVERWARAHLGSLGRLNSGDSLMQEQHVLLYVTGRLIACNEKQLHDMSEFPKPTLLGEADAHRADIDPVLTDLADQGQIAQLNMVDVDEDERRLGVLRGIAEQEDLVTDNYTETPIRQWLFRLKRFGVYDCLAGRRLKYVDGSAPNTLMSKGARAESKSFGAYSGAAVGEGLTVEDWNKLEAAYESGLIPELIKLEAKWCAVRRRIYIAWAEGLSPKQIAVEFRLNYRIVKNHLDAARHAVKDVRDRFAVTKDRKGNL